MPGPNPTPNPRRRNQPSIPQTPLPPEGRQGDPPEVPANYELGEHGSRWWEWAWHTPQATKWDKGAHMHAARRAQLEDDLAALDMCITPGEVGEVLGLNDSEEVAKAGIDDEALLALAVLIGRLKGLATGRLAVMKEMRELDNRLGLNPEAMAKLRWVIEPKAVDGDKPEVANLDDYRELYSAS